MQEKLAFTSGDDAQKKWDKGAVMFGIAFWGRFLVKYTFKSEVGGINRLPCPGKVLGLLSGQNPG